MKMTLGTKEWAKYNVNFSKGCSNNCKYCYARRMGDRFGWKKSENWTEMDNREEMATKGFRLRDGNIMSPSSHDITSFNIELAIKVFKNILSVGNKLLIVSKPKCTLVKAICSEIENWKSQVIFRFTIGSLDDRIRAYWEPNAPTFEDRLDSLKYAFSNGWRTSVSIEPFLDENVPELIRVIDNFVTDTIWVGPMNKIHVPKDLWTQNEEKLYSAKNLQILKNKIDNLKSEKVMFKDHFLSKCSS